MKPTEIVEPKGKPRYDYAEARKLYERHRESLPGKDQTWRYRYGWPAVLAIVIMYCAYFFHPINLAHMPWNPLINGLVFGALGFFGAISGAHFVYLRQCVRVLKNAQIDVPERDPEPSYKELWRERKELRQHRMKSHHKAWQLTRFALPVMVPVAFLGLVYFVPGGTFPAKPLAHQLTSSAAIFVAIGGYLALVAECCYLSKLWRQVHLGK